MFHFTGGVVDSKSGKLDALGEDLQSVNAAFAAIGPEVMRLGNPVAVYSTPVTKTEKDKSIEGAATVPSGLTAIPEDTGFAVEKGEVLIGTFRDPEQREVFAFASHNAYQPQEVTGSPVV